MAAAWGLLVSLLTKLFAGDHISSSTDQADQLFRPCANDTDIIESLVGATSGYNRNKVPDKPVQVRVEFWLQSITSFNEMTQDFVIDLQINEYWTDPALYYAHMHPCKQSLMFDKKILDRLWTPNTCFIDSKEAQIHESPFINVFLMIYPNGSLWVNYRIKLTGPCEMDLARFPWDQQICRLTFESYNYNTDEVRMAWAAAHDQDYTTPFELPDFMMTLMTMSAEEAKYPAGGWDELTARFVFERRYGWYILQGYIPTYTTIFISWISFYLGTKAIPARTMIGVNCLLAMTFQFSSIISNLPRVHYVKAMDVWMLGCVTFIFMSLLELALVGFMTRYPERRLMQNAGSRWSKRDLEKHSIAWTVTADTRRDILLSSHRFGSDEFCRVGEGGGAASGLSSTSIGKPGCCSPMHLYGGEAGTGTGGVGKATSPCGDYHHHRGGGGGPAPALRGGWSCGDCLRCVRVAAKACLPTNPDHLDSFSAVFFPTAFFAFNLCYWSYYLLFTSKHRPRTAASPEV